MDKKTLKSSIKAYCLELMKEMNSLGGGGEGAYMTKFAGRKVTSKDKISPTGFETSPKNNYYKKFKFRVTNPYPRKNSIQIWEQNQPTPNNFPIKINSWEQGRLVKDWLEKYGYELKGDTNLFDQKIDFPFYINHMKEKTLWVSSKNKIYEIKIKNPGISKLDSDNLNKLKDLISIEIKDIIEEDIHSLKYHILENDENFQQFVINDMIHNNFHFFYKNQEILLSHSNQHLLKESTILNYFKDNTELQNFLFKVILKYFFDNIDMPKIYKNIKDGYFLLKKSYQKSGDVITDWDLEHLIRNNIDFDDIYLWDIINDFHFYDFLNKQINNYK